MSKKLEFHIRFLLDLGIEIWTNSTKQNRMTYLYLPVDIVYTLASFANEWS